ncbi:MAG: hypothetical protein V1913_15725, partial [Fibrobacterota bacterium]
MNAIDRPGIFIDIQQNPHYNLLKVQKISNLQLVGGVEPIFLSHLLALTGRNHGLSVQSKCSLWAHPRI